MTAELFSGTYKALETKLNAIILGGATINNLFKLNGGQYMILYT